MQSLRNYFSDYHLSRVARTAWG